MTDNEAWTIPPEQREEIVRQLGTMNILSISGGRITALPDGIELPVSSGMVVRVHLTQADDYTVERVFKRGLKEFDHGKRERTYTDEVGEAAYRASCYKSYSDGEWQVW